MWTRERKCEEVIDEVWAVEDCSNGLTLMHKLERCGEALTRWNHMCFGNLNEKIRRKRKDLSNALQGDGGEDNRAEIAKTQGELDELLCKEEILWRQRSKQLWMREGDRNTAFFHSTATKRKERNTICSLIGEDGKLYEKQEDMEGIATNYFRHLFLSACDAHMVNSIGALAKRKVTDNQNTCLLEDYKEEEIRTALNDMDPGKSPGPDGMNACFYQKHWNIVGRDVTRMALGILNGFDSVAALNETYIVLIPKTTKAEKMTDFRPISLCNIIYKIVAKVLANRLKLCLTSIIDVAQSAFVAGRYIYDNSMVAHEVIHTMQHHKTGKEGEIALKLDMSKAYDRVEWLYLEKMMMAVGIAPGFVEKVMDCVTSVRYSVLINGVPTEWFFPTRGLR